jgi:hypothetical protein
VLPASEPCTIRQFRCTKALDACMSPIDCFPQKGYVPVRSEICGTAVSLSLLNKIRKCERSWSVQGPGNGEFESGLCVLARHRKWPLGKCVSTLKFTNLVDEVRVTVKAHICMLCFCQRPLIRRRYPLKWDQSS